MNPFASRFIRPDNNVYRFAHDLTSDESIRGTFTGQLLNTLRSHRRAAIVGPHGTGKTTLLRSIDTDLRAAFGYVVRTTLTTEKRHSFRELLTLIDSVAATNASPMCLIVDGYEQLRWWDQIALVCCAINRKSLALLVTCHQRPRLFPTCLETKWDEAISRTLTYDKLVDVPEETRLQLCTAFENRLAGGDCGPLNLRELWFEMYDEFERIRHREEQRA